MSARVQNLISRLQNEIVFVAVRSRGPGGQNVNKVSSAAMMFWAYDHSPLLSAEEKFLIRTKISGNINADGQIYLRSDEYRDLQRNKDRCLEKLAAMLALAFHREKPRKATKPTRSSQAKKRETKARRGDIKKSRSKKWSPD